MQSGLAALARALANSVLACWDFDHTCSLDGGETFIVVSELLQPKALGFLHSQLLGSESFSFSSFLFTQGGGGKWGMRGEVRH